jgi:hypothetical protein
MTFDFVSLGVNLGNQVRVVFSDIAHSEKGSFDAGVTQQLEHYCAATYNPVFIVRPRCVVGYDVMVPIFEVN